MGKGGTHSFNITTYFARPDALRGSLKDTLAVARLGLSRIAALYYRSSAS